MSIKGQNPVDWIREVNEVHVFHSWLRFSIPSLLESEYRSASFQLLRTT